MIYENTQRSHFRVKYWVYTELKQSCTVYCVVNKTDLSKEGKSTKPPIYTIQCICQINGKNVSKKASLRQSIWPNSIKY
jgi:hypothetical protein